jgi:hypothetical protein
MVATAKTCQQGRIVMLGGEDTGSNKRPFSINWIVCYLKFAALSELSDLPRCRMSVMRSRLELAIDVPPKALVWEDDQGKVWLSYNSSDYLYNTIYPRHGAAVPPATAPFAKLLDEMSDQATN